MVFTTWLKCNHRMSQGQNLLHTNSVFTISFKKERTCLDVEHSLQRNFSRGDGTGWVGVWGKGNLLWSMFSCRVDEVP